MEKHNPQNNTIDNGEIKLDFIELIKKLSTSVGDEIVIAVASGENERAEELIVDTAFESLSQNQEYKENMTKLRAQGRGHDDSSLTKRNNELLQHYRSIIINELGLEDQSLSVKLEDSRMQTHELLEGISSEREALIALGLATKSEDGDSLAYQWNSRLFPDETNDKWNAYLASVADHLLAARAVTEETKHKVQEKDSARSLAHASVTRDVFAVIGTSMKRVSPYWDFTRTRQLIASIRENTIPDGVQADSEEVRQLLKAHEDKLDVLGVLCRQNNKLQ